MASSLKGNAIVYLLLLVLLLHCFAVNSSTLFDVGGENGWTIPNPKDVDHFNDWASKTRFNVNDTLHFKYVKDSVLEVTQENYEKCQASHPIYFSNNGDTKIILDRPDLFYFISGVGGHCDKGLKMVIKVLGSDNSSQPRNQTSPASGGFGKPFTFRVIIMTVLSMLGFGVINFI